MVRLRLPTYFCAPNFAYLMVADSSDAVTKVPGVTAAEVILEDHFASDPINAGVAAPAGFVKSFDGEAVSELGDLRLQFLRKAVIAGTDQVCRPLVAAGVTPDELLALTLGAVPGSPELPGCANAAPNSASPPATIPRCWSTRTPGHRSTPQRYRSTFARPG